MSLSLTIRFSHVSYIACTFTRIHDDLSRLLFLQADRKYFRLIDEASLQYKCHTPDYLSERKFAVFLKPEVRLPLAKATAIQMSVGSEPSYVPTHDSLPPQPCSTRSPPLCLPAQLHSSTSHELARGANLSSINRDMEQKKKGIQELV
jgi:hypothetical protein